MVKFKQTSEVLKIMGNIEQIRNIGITAHVDHGKTTLSDTLLSAAGLISEKIAGQALALDYLDVEQKRQMTVKAANASLYHEYKGKPYLINLIDTPGHVDFQSKTIRALRVIDGAIVVVDAVEGVMTQTEMYLRVALEERVRPVLFINKIDRLIKELRLSPTEIQQRLVQIVRDVNTLIATYADKEFQKAWLLDPMKGQVAFGSARDRWGLTIPLVQQKGIKFSDIVDVYTRGKEAVAELQKTAPLHEAILDMVVKHIPNPREAQRYRIPKIWHGDPNHEIVKYLMEADPNGPLVMLINDIRVDPHAGLVATGRIYSGTLRPGEEVWLVNARVPQRVLQVSLYMGPYRELADEITAGNIAAALGLEKARSGETVVSMKYKDTMTPFEKLKMITESVVTVAIEPKNPQQTTKLIDALYKLHLEDPSLIVKINEETGEYLLSGVGTLHIEIALTLLKDLYGLEVVTSPPVIVYRETIRDRSQVFEGKSPNKHNKFYISVTPLNEETLRLLSEGIIMEDMDARERAKILREQAGWDADEARRIMAIDENLNILIDMTTGVQYLREVKDTIIQGFRLAMREGPLAMEPVRGVKVVLHDAVIHEDPAHRGPAQIFPAVRNAIFAGFLTARPTILEPILKLDIRSPMEYIGNISSVITKKRGKLIEVQQMETTARVIAEIPVSESFDIADMLRNVTAGKAIWGQEFSRWAPVPENMLMDLIAKIRTRKGLKPEPPKPEDFLSP
ncbi:translation elongation factor EF-2 [Desulfurococcus amylolyticus 1221n]|uniref:Elongation factor 2 n=1 Tax=Desulfurococcus amylolyticus (strain DSM 18924 / JCM 16383 / VKM B-2413 / 1221n) TaxID=490899 RepID=EF2_DESA1|nr:elongation factor EF-2 [Desulfurococcus amylolyticus]B8D6B2.1 RecName: Full=Elongation factor 2; Short=EF-2 [Desulfurococcus amylolyticus 1221n]ACL11643.1 translation elongation factor EF-2 [Desulfurococcus amylolyticus 1221n]